MPSPALQRLANLPASPLSTGAAQSPVGGTNLRPVGSASTATSPQEPSPLDVRAAAERLSTVTLEPTGVAKREQLPARPALPHSAYTVLDDEHRHGGFRPPASVRLQMTGDDVLAASRQASGLRRITHDQPLSRVEIGKRAAAYAAVDRHVKPDHRVIGVGSGSTVPYVVERIAQRPAEENEDRWCAGHGRGRS